MERASENLTEEQAADLFERFLYARQAALIDEIRGACGISARPRRRPRTILSQTTWRPTSGPA